MAMQNLQSDIIFKTKQMKKRSLFIGLLIGLLSFSSCNDDDNNLEPQNQSKFTINGTEYLTPNGYIISATDGVNNSVHAIYLINGTIINNEWYGLGCDFSNNLTQGVIFNIRSTSITELAEGTYNYQLNTSDPTLNETSISTNMVTTNNCVTSSVSIDENQINSGNLIIEKTGNVYTLTYTFSTTDFGTITGNYIGELQLTTDLSD